jgi:hypothetical protein
VDAREVRDRLLLRHLHLLAPARRLALHDRGEDAHPQVEARPGVAESRGHAQRRPVRLAVEAHGAGHRLRHELEALVVRVRPRRGEPLDGRGDQARVEALQRLPAEAEAVHGPGAEVLDDHVGLAQEIVEQRAAARVLQVEREALLVRVEEEEAPAVDAGPVAQREAVGLAGERLDLDDLGAQPREELRAGRAGLVLAEVDDADAVEGFGHWAKSPEMSAGAGPSPCPLPLTGEREKEGAD